MNTPNLTDLERSLAEAQEISRALATDAQQAKSQFAAPLRSAIDHAAELFAHHQNWLKENAPKA